MRQRTKAILITAAAVLGVFWVIPAAANLIIDYNWWREIGQVDTWIGMLWYSIAPVGIATVVAAVALWVAHARGTHFAGVQRHDHPLYSIPRADRYVRTRCTPGWLAGPATHVAGSGSPKV